MVATPDFTVDATGTDPNTAQSLVASVYRRTLAPKAAGAYQSGAIIQFLDEEMRAAIVPLVLAAQEEFFVQNIDQAIVAGVTQYTMPTRASFASWRDVCMVDTNGMEINLTLLSPEYLKVTYPAGGNPPLYVFGVILQHDQIIFWPPNQAQLPITNKVRMKIKREPNFLTSTTNVGQITNIAGKVCTLGNADTTWTTSTTFDVIPNSPLFTSRQDDATITALSVPAGGPYSVTFSTLPTGTIVGDWVCPSRMSPIPQIPYEMFPLLCQRGAIKVLEGLGDTQNLQVAERRYQDMAADFARTVSPRIEGMPKKIVNRNTPPYWGNYGFPFQR